MLRDRDSRRRTILMAMIFGVLLSGVVVLTVSRAAFSASTSNSGNRIAAGTVTLGDDDGDSAMFDVTGVAPGAPSLVRCIEVTYSGTITDPDEIRLYSSGFTDSGTLADELNLKVDIGTGATTLDDCSNFSLAGTIFATDTLSAFHATHANYVSGLVAWDPGSTPESRTFRFTIDLPADADSSAQGASVTDLVFTWEVQS